MPALLSVAVDAGDTQRAQRVPDQGIPDAWLNVCTITLSEIVAVLSLSYSISMFGFDCN
jgi:hypothetical protein